MSEQEKKLHWMASGVVVTSHRSNGHSNSYNFNVLLTTQHEYITRNDLAKVQEGMCQRFVNECPQISGFKISDVFIMNIFPLGLMTSEEFNEVFQAPEPANAG